MAAKRVQESEYSRYYGAFRGVDFSNDESQVSPARFSYSRNMYKDYDSGQGVAVETIAGFRMRNGFGGRKIYGIHKSAETGENGEPVYYVHCGFELYRTADWGTKTLVYNAMNEHFSKSFVLYGRLYILDGANYLVVKDGTVESVKDAAPYIPTTYINIVASGVNANAGTEYEQRNMLSPYFKNTFIHSIESGASSAWLFLSESNVDEITEVNFYGAKIASGPRFGLCYWFIKNNNIEHLEILTNNTSANSGTTFPMNGSQITRQDVEYAEYLVITTTAESGLEDAHILHSERIETPLKFIHIATADKMGIWTYVLNENGETLVCLQADATRKELSVCYDDRFFAILKIKGDCEPVKNVNTGMTTYTIPLNNHGDIKESYEIDVVATGDTQNFKGYLWSTSMPDRPVGFKLKCKYASTFSKDYAGIEVTAKKTYRSLDGTDLPEGKDVSAAITGCTEVAIFDGRVFLTGNPLFPNSLFYCSYNNVTGYADPTYFGVLNRVRDGFDATAITGMIPLGDTLMTLKEDSEQDGIIYYHTPTSGGNDLTPTIYPSKQGAVGAGCIAGACANFNDEQVFLTRLGLRAVTKLSTNLERSIEERSSLINNKLLKSNLKNAQLAEWNGYLCILVDGDMYMADSRQRYQDEVGRLQYEWYYISKLGQYEGQFDEYRYSGSMPEEFAGATVQYTVQGMQYEAFLKLADAVYFPDLYVTENLCGQVANEPFADGGERIPIYSAEIEGKTVSFVPDASDPRVVYLCETKGAKIGGRFCPATVLKSLDGNMFFGTENGYVYSFNFDLRDGEGKIPINAYNFDGRAIECGIATVMDNCGIPHMTKTTVKHSTVLKTKAFKNSCIKFKVRTNDNAYKAVQTVNSGIFSFDDVDFSDLTFNVDNKTIFAIREKEKRWVEKQYYLYSDEPNKPFGVYNAAFRYRLAGRYKS